MTELTDDLIAATRAMIDRVRIDTGTPAAGISDALWEALQDAGFTSVDVPTEAGGHGCETADAVAVLGTVIESGALVPFIEHALLAEWLCGRAGRSVGAGTATVGIAEPGAVVDSSGDRPRISATVRDVVHVADAALLVVLVPSADGAGDALAATVPLAQEGVSVAEGRDLVGASVGTVVLESAAVTACSECPVTPAGLRQRGALVHAAAMAAAAGAIRDRTVRYASERVQFGRPLAEFQAVAQQLAALAASTALMEISARRAVAISSGDPRLARNAAAAAKVVASLHSHSVAATGHQIHGAIGFTSEHPLARWSTALWTWRDRYGTEGEWAHEIGSLLIDEDLDPWDLITETARTPHAPDAEDTPTERTSR